MILLNKYLGLLFLGFIFVLIIDIAGVSSPKSWPLYVRDIV